MPLSNLKLMSETKIKDGKSIIRDTETEANHLLNVI